MKQVHEVMTKTVHSLICRRPPVGGVSFRLDLAAILGWPGMQREKTSTSQLAVNRQEGWMEGDWF